MITVACFMPPPRRKKNPLHRTSHSTTGWGGPRLRVMVKTQRGQISGIREIIPGHYMFSPAAITTRQDVRRSRFHHLWPPSKEASNWKSSGITLPPFRRSPLWYRHHKFQKCTVASSLTVPALNESPSVGRRAITGAVGRSPWSMRAKRRFRRSRLERSAPSRRRRLRRSSGCRR
jgi:hypothetical protein